MANRRGKSRRFIFLGSKITVDGDCSDKIKRELILGRKSMTDLESILKNKDISFPINIHIVRAMAFLVVIYGYESWAVKMDKWQIIDALELWSWKRLLRVPWKMRRSNSSILKSFNPEYWLEWQVLNPKLQYFGYLMWRAKNWKSVQWYG